ncbi:C40 family peptidase [Bacillus cereus]
MVKRSIGILLAIILSVSVFSIVTYADDASEYVDKSFYAYDEPSFTSTKANHGAAYEPLTITVKEKRNDGWWKVVTWEGEKWINTTGERKYIDKKFYAYDEPSFTSAKANSGGAYEPLTLTVTDGNPQGWLKVVTWEGEKWINTTGERKYIDKKFDAYNEPSFTSAKANFGGAYEPLTLTVTDGNSKGWLKVVTWEGEKWINTTGERKYIDKKFYAYNEPSFTSAKANSGGAYEPLTLTVTDGNTQGWLKVVTWEGEKWINTTGERRYIDKKFYAYNEPSFTSVKANSGGVYEPLTLTVTDENTQGWLKVVTWEGEKWINTTGERKYIDKKFYAYNEPSFTSAKANSGGAYEPLTLTVTDGNTQGWLKVVTWEGEKWINLNETVSSSSGIVDLATKLLGKPYVFGADGPNAFDCSGFISYVFKNNGYKIGRNSVAGYWGMVTKISDPQPGDLVFLQNTYKAGPSHLGIYIGNGEYIHAADETTGVIKSKINSSYTQKHFLGYARFSK